MVGIKVEATTNLLKEILQDLAYNDKQVLAEKGTIMKLKRVQVTEYQSIHDSNEFEISDITCLVGKNEAGKTALLQALHKLNPLVTGGAVYSVTDNYPRWDVEDYRFDVEEGKRKPAIVTRAVFELDEEDITTISNALGENTLKNSSLTLSKGYANALYFQISTDESAALKHFTGAKFFAPEVSKQLESCTTIDAALDALQAAEQTEATIELVSDLQAVKTAGGLDHYAYALLKPRVPKFLYFDEYYQMEGRANIEVLKQRKSQATLKPSDYPLLGLISLARLDLDELLNPTRTRDLKNKIEGASNHLTKRVVDYWSQNRYLQLRFDVRPARPEDPEGMQNGTNIWGDVYDSKHMVTTELGSRSRGFVWFFSFLAWYSDIKRQNEPVILLLDEPGLTLHAKAQEDLLRYFEAEVKGSHQLIYTTHSPFMVDASRFDRVRIVQDLNIDSDADLPLEKQGTKVLADVLDASGDTLFPLQGALGYEIYQTLFVGPNSLVVEGVSDLLYLQTMSALLQERGRTSLDPLWTITPVGGSDKVPTFVALIGAQKKLNIAVLIDFQRKDRQTIENLYVRKLLSKKNVLTFIDFVSAVEADIEDMFEPDFYLKLVNAEYAASLSKPIGVSDLIVGIPRVVTRIEKYLEANTSAGVTLNHFRPARYLTEHLTTLKGDISEATLDRFEDAFTRLNALIK